MWVTLTPPNFEKAIAPGHQVMDIVLPLKLSDDDYCRIRKGSAVICQSIAPRVGATILESATRSCEILLPAHFTTDPLAAPMTFS